jgi:hypothetical protein
MLTREIMGGLALAILWVNTLLIAAAAAREAGERWRTLRALRSISPGKSGIGLLRGRVEQGAGPGGELARYEVQQLGRAGAETKGRRTIHFADRSWSGTVLGGVVQIGETRLRVAAAEGEVWPDADAVTSAAACGGQERFDGVFAEARKAKGHARTVTTEIGAGEAVWLAGEVIASGDAFELQPGKDLGLIVSAIEPRAWLRRAVAIAGGFAIVEVAVAAGLTLLVLVPPVFDGWPSTLGGVLCLAFFLAVQPLGTAVRDAVRPPGRASVRGLWIEPSPRAAAAPSGSSREADR